MDRGLPHAENEGCSMDPAADSAVCWRGRTTSWCFRRVPKNHYHSARSVEEVVQVGVISCSVFTSTPLDQVEVELEANDHEVAIRCQDDNTVLHFRREQFEVNGVLPQPAV